ncbi:MAG: hypothetical protein ACI89L_000126 [Phycisphaerales bacterium]|jgi:hypothetical protein
MQHITPPALLLALSLASPALAGDGAKAEFKSLLMESAASHSSFRIADENGASLDITGYLLTRYLVGRSSGFGDKDYIVGFDQPRVRLGAKGEINDTFGFKMIVDYAGGGAALTDGYATIKLDDGMTLRTGQFTLPYTREQDVSSSRQTAVERSVANSFFTGDRSQGVMLEVKKDDWRWRGSLSDGFKSTNSEYLATNDADVAFTTRYEYLVDGKWSQFKDHEGWRGGERGLMLGGAMHYQSTGNTAALSGSTPTTTSLDDVLAFTLDASAEFSGASALAAFYYQSRETSSGDFTDMGFVLQGGVMVADQTEVFARWDSILSDSDRTANDDVHVITAGLNYFFVPESHALKFTLDVQHVLSDLNSGPVGTSSKRTIVASDDAQTALRAQFVLIF